MSMLWESDCVFSMRRLFSTDALEPKEDGLRSEGGTEGRTTRTRIEVAE
jgi:hypothetical protein